MRQLCPRRLGRLVQAKSASILVGLLLALLALCVAIKSAKLDAELSSWIQRTGRIESEMKTLDAALGEGSGANSLLLLQAPRQQQQPQQQQQRPSGDVLTVDALMVHLEAMAIANHVTVDLYEVSWSLKDLCFAPTLPDFEGLHVSMMLDNLMPCAIKTPLDCFWEGSKLLGPEQPVTFGSLGPKLKWSSLNPLFMVETLQRSYPHASFSYSTLIEWMRRVGITTGYQTKPCLDPTDSECPKSAPNKISGQAPNVAKTLTGGCRGVAANLMHWREEELVGGVSRNRSGHITRASALQSSIQLMGEQDMYDYWRKTSKVQDVSNWSPGKAKEVLETWQQRYKEELAQFTRDSSASSAYIIHAMTTKSMLEPIDMKSLLDLTNVEVCFIIMTAISCLLFPNFQHDKANSHFQISVGRSRMFILASVTSFIVGLTFVASLGLSSFMNLPINIATAYILPPLALYYGFRQSMTVATVYASKSMHVPSDQLTTECLDELLPVILIESASCIFSLLVASFVPVQATQVFAFQAITFTLMSTFVATILLPAMFTTFIFHHLIEPQDQDPPDYFSVYSESKRPKSRSDSPGRFSLFKKTKLADKDENKAQDLDIEDQIMSRIKDDLKNIKADPRPTPNMNFTAQLDVNGLQTSFKLTTSQSYNNSNTNEMEICEHSGFMSNRIDQLNESSNHMECIPTKDYDTDSEFSDHCSISDSHFEEVDMPERIEDRKSSWRLMEIFANSITSNKFLQSAIIVLKVLTLIIILSYASNVRYGLNLRDIVVRGTPEYESFSLQEKYFPIYNIFAITKGNYDYPSNQQLLYEYHRSISNVDGIIREEDNGKPRFWLSYFRDWLLEIQNKFDIDRNNSAISSEGWTPDASDAAKLAYKLLAQTGRVDNPIDKSQVDTNRLVDSQGIINPRAFYYYLTAWVINDAFTYSTSGANFRPEPKIWNGNPDDLRIEKARPLTYTQLPFLVRLPSSHDNLKTVLDIRSTSQAFEQLGLSNFPAGIPFTFWDQFIDLDYIYIAAIFFSSALIYISTVWVTSNLYTASIIVLPLMITLTELYGLMGILAIPFNNILAVLLMSTSGISIVQTVHLATTYEMTDGTTTTRVLKSIKRGFRIVLYSLVLFFVCVLVFRNSKIDFMIRYSTLLLCLAVSNSFNSILFTPVLLSVFGPRYRPLKTTRQETRIERLPSTKKVLGKKSNKKTKGFKGRGYPRVKSEISLSTISEEPQSEANVHDFKLDFSIRCSHTRADG